jgi:hypothetical protein
MRFLKALRMCLALGFKLSSGRARTLFPLLRSGRTSVPTITRQ